MQGGPTPMAVDVRNRQGRVRRPVLEEVVLAERVMQPRVLEIVFDDVKLGGVGRRWRRFSAVATA